MTAAGTVNTRVPAGRKVEKGRESCLACPLFDLVLDDLARQRIAVDAERVGGLRQAAVAAPEHARDEPFFELVDGVLELDAPFDHFFDESLELVANHGSRGLPPPPVRSAGEL